MTSPNLSRPSPGWWLWIANLTAWCILYALPRSATIDGTLGATVNTALNGLVFVISFPLLWYFLFIPGGNPAMEAIVVGIVLNGFIWGHVLALLIRYVRGTRKIT